MGSREIDRWDFLIVMAILATLTVVLRLNNQREEPEPNPLLLATRSASAMETVWRDAVSERRDLRPLKEPDMVWEDQNAPRPEARLEPAAKAEAVKDAVKEPEPFFPKPIKVAEPAAPAPRMEPMRDSLLNEAGGGAHSAAFLQAPETPRPR